MAAKCYVSPPIDLQKLNRNFSRADIIFDEVDHAGASYEARIFLNNPSADETTEKTPEQGYAGSFNIFGHGGCFGDVGHCDLKQRRDFDPRGENPLTPAKKTVIATEAVRRVLKQGGDVTVTIVPIVKATTPKLKDVENVLKFGKLSVIAYC